MGAILWPQHVRNAVETLFSLTILMFSFCLVHSILIGSWCLLALRAPAVGKRGCSRATSGRGLLQTTMDMKKEMKRNVQNSKRGAYGELRGELRGVGVRGSGACAGSAGKRRARSSVRSF